MRSAPESLVQAQIAKFLAARGDIVLLEASIKDILAVSRSEPIPDVSRGEKGRVDIAVYYKSPGKRKFPRLVVEVKKLTTHHSLDQDYARIVGILNSCPEIQNGVMVGYGTALTADTAARKVQVVTQHLACKRAATLDPIKVSGKDGRTRYLAAGVYRVGRE